MNRRAVERVAFDATAVLMVSAGLQSAFAPRSFFDDFPFGRGWIAHDGEAFNEHLVRDVGALFLALIVVIVWTAWRGGHTRAVAVAWLVQGDLHLTYHAGHLNGYHTVDRVGLITSLVVLPALAIVALWAGWSTPKAAGL